jgi:hypothetical protein
MAFVSRQEEAWMPKALRILAIAAALAAETSGAAIAQGYYPCPAGYTLAGGVCQVTSGAVGAAGAIVGGALNATGNIVGGTVGAVTGAPPPPACAGGYVYYNGGCYPAR